MADPARIQGMDAGHSSHSEQHPHSSVHYVAGKLALHEAGSTQLQMLLSSAQPASPVGQLEIINVSQCEIWFFGSAGAAGQEVPGLCSHRLHPALCSGGSLRWLSQAS